MTTCSTLRFLWFIFSKVSTVSGAHLYVKVHQSEKHRSILNKSTDHGDNGRSCSADLSLHGRKSTSSKIKIFDYFHNPSTSDLRLYVFFVNSSSFSNVEKSSCPLNRSSILMESPCF